MRVMTPGLRSWTAALVAAAFLAGTGPASFAQTPPQPPPPSTPSPSGDEKPWQKGVSPEDQKIANGLFKEGNALLRDSFFVKAVEKYREAVSHWDHPAIHYNLAVALINLDQPIEVYTSLEKAMQYGTLALDQEKLDLGERYKKLVEAQLVWVTVSCTEPDARVTIDGKEALICPGSEEKLMRAGEHSFTATKPGFETTAETRTFAGGTKETVALRLWRPEDLTGYERRFPAWLPWTVTGAGVLLAGIGGVLHSAAISDYDEFDAWAQQCEEETQMGCPLTPEARSLRDGGDTKQSVAGVMYVAGGVAVAAGLTLVLLNRPRPFRIDRESSEPTGVTVVPVVSSDGAGISAAFRF